MAGQPPIELKVEKVEPGTGGFGDVSILDEVLFEGEGRTVPLWFQKGTEPPAEGDTVKGWWNTVKSGKNEGQRYFRRADDKPSGGRGPAVQGMFPTSGGRDDATGRSIERQVAAKVAGELFAAKVLPFESGSFAQDFRYATDAIVDAIRGE